MFLMEAGVSSIRGTECDNAGACHSPGYTVLTKKKVSASLSPRQKKKNIPCCFQGPKQRNLLFVPGTKHPRCVYLHLTGSMVSRGRNSLQLVFVLTKAFIAKVQELTSLGRQEGDKRGPLETQHKHTHSLFSHSYTHTQMTTTPSGFAHFLSLFHTAHNTHCTMVYHACTLLYGVRRGHFNAQNR